MPSIKAFIALEKTLAAVLVSEWEKHGGKAVEDLHAALSAKDFQKAHDIANAFTLTNIVEKHRNRIEELVVSSLLFGASNVVPLKHTMYVGKQHPVPQVLDGVIDQLTMAIEEDASDLIRQQMLALINVEEHGHKTTLMEPVAKTDNPFHELFDKVIQLRKDDSIDIAQALNAMVMGTGKGLMNIGANLTTSRAVSYGFLSQAVDSGVDTYQVTEILDDKICPVCKFMHGKMFSVSHEIGRVEQALLTQDPQDLKSIAPWPKQSKAGLADLFGMSNEDLQAAGYGSPPYHPGCRGVLVKVGNADEIMPSMPALPVGLPAGVAADATLGATGKLAGMDTATLVSLISQISDLTAYGKATDAWAAGDWGTLEDILTEQGLL